MHTYKNASHNHTHTTQTHTSPPSPCIRGKEILHGLAVPHREGALRSVMAVLLLHISFEEGCRVRGQRLQNEGTQMLLPMANAISRSRVPLLLGGMNGGLRGDQLKPDGESFVSIGRSHKGFQWIHNMPRMIVLFFSTNRLQLVLIINIIIAMLCAALLSCTGIIPNTWTMQRGIQSADFDSSNSHSVLIRFY
jgi:hypothetical protein